MSEKLPHTLFSALWALEMAQGLEIPGREDRAGGSLAACVPRTADFSFPNLADFTWKG